MCAHSLLPALLLNCITDAVGATAVVFVVDAADRARIGEAAAAIATHVTGVDELKGQPLLIAANKQDLPGAMTHAEIVDALDLKAMRRPWHVVVRVDLPPMTFSLTRRPAHLWRVRCRPRDVLGLDPPSCCRGDNSQPRST
jgi:hypothetical protein